MIEIKDKSLCSGCSACASVCPKKCISMKTDAEGCEYPEVDQSKCIECGMCEKVCPIANPVVEKPCFQMAYLVQHKDKEILRQSTSGGAFTAIATEIIKQGGIVYGAGVVSNKTYSVDLAELKVEHFPVFEAGDLSKFRNSKYVQSYINDTFVQIKKYLDSGTIVLFSGTPCQCEGLLSYLGVPYENLITVDFVCRAVPIRGLWVKYAEWLAGHVQVQNGRVVFRDKSKYGYSYSNLALYRDEDDPVYFSGVESDPYLRAFFSNLCDRPVCYSCPFKKRYRRTDLTLWDFFDVGRMSEMLDNNLGVTRVLTHSKAGEAIMESVVNGGSATVETVDPDLMISGFNEMYNSVPYNEKRSQFVEDLEAMDGASLMDKWFPDTMRVKAERVARRTLQSLGVYDKVKFAIKKMLNR